MIYLACLVFFITAINHYVYSMEILPVESVQADPRRDAFLMLMDNISLKESANNEIKVITTNESIKFIYFLIKNMPANYTPSLDPMDHERNTFEAIRYVKEFFQVLTRHTACFGEFDRGKVEIGIDPTLLAIFSAALDDKISYLPKNSPPQGQEKSENTREDFILKNYNAYGMTVITSLSRHHKEISKKQSRNEKLIQASGNGDVDKVTRLINKSAYVNSVDADNYTALAKVISMSSELISKEQTMPIAQALLNVGCDPNVVTSEGKTALDFAIERNDSVLFRLLTRHGGKVKNSSQEMLIQGLEKAFEPGLLRALYIRDEQQIRLFLTQNSEVVKDKDNISAFAYAAGQGNQAAVSLLLKMHAYQKDAFGIAQAVEIVSNRLKGLSPVSQEYKNYEHVFHHR